MTLASSKSVDHPASYSLRARGVKCGLLLSLSGPCRSRVAARRSSKRDQPEENGQPYISYQVNDIDMESDMWKSKPAWCQPWTILTTGAVVITASWLLFQSLVFTLLSSLVVFAWWYLFLILVPSSYAAAARQVDRDRE